MGKTELTKDEDSENSDRVTFDSGKKQVQLIMEGKFVYPEKRFELPKENSFSSGTTSSSGTEGEKGKTSRSVCGESEPLVIPFRGPKKEKMVREVNLDDDQPERKKPERKSMKGNRSKDKSAMEKWRRCRWRANVSQENGETIAMSASPIGKNPRRRQQIPPHKSIDAPLCMPDYNLCMPGYLVPSSLDYHCLGDYPLTVSTHNRACRPIMPGTEKSLFTLCLALGACISGSYVMWATDFFDLFVQQNLIIRNNSMRYEAWKSPPVHAFLRIYIFNYTNVRDFENGIDSKLKIEQLGPFTYKEKWERVDVRFNENGTATYRDRKVYSFSPEHSRGNESDVIVVPNLPVLSAMSVLTRVSLVRWPLMGLMSMIGAEPFISLNVSDFLWGYEDKFSVLAQYLLSLRYDLPFKKFGILSAKNGTQKDLVTIFTGEADSSKTGIVASYDGKTSLSYWNSKECNRIDGTDGTIYPPSMVRLNSTLYVYSKDLCRKMPLTYSDQYLDKHGIPVLRFRIAEGVFASGHAQKENLCFCSHAGSEVKCLPTGLFNVGPCAFEAPLVTSLPHFLYGDSILSKGLEGLNPTVDEHESYVEVDRKMGFPVGGKSRLQLNIMPSREYGSVRRSRAYKNQIVFPITWVDYGIDRLPDDVSATIRNLIAFIKVAQLSLSYGFVICSLLFGILVVHGCFHSLPGELFSCLCRNWRRSEELQSETPLFPIRGKR